MQCLRQAAPFPRLCDGPLPADVFPFHCAELLCGMLLHSPWPFWLANVIWCCHSYVLATSATRASLATALSFLCALHPSCCLFASSLHCCHKCLVRALRSEIFSFFVACILQSHDNTITCPSTAAVGQHNGTELTISHHYLSPII